MNVTLIFWDSFTPMDQQVFYRTNQNLCITRFSFFNTVAPNLLPPASFSIAMDEHDVEQTSILIWFGIFEQISFFFFFFRFWLKWKKWKLSLNVSCSIWFDFPFNGSFYFLASEFCVSIQFLESSIEGSILWQFFFSPFRFIAFPLPAPLRCFISLNSIFLFSKCSYVCQTIFPVRLTHFQLEIDKNHCIHLYIKINVLQHITLHYVTYWIHTWFLFLLVVLHWKCRKSCHIRLKWK